MLLEILVFVDWCGSASVEFVARQEHLNVPPSLLKGLSLEVLLVRSGLFKVMVSIAGNVRVALKPDYLHQMHAEMGRHH